MVEDAKFEDGVEQAVALLAEDAEDLGVISALTQDAVFPITEMKWDATKRQFALLLNRFRWEDKDFAERQARTYERVQAVLVFDSVLSVASNGLDRTDKDMILSLLHIGFVAGDDGAGTIELTLAGDGAIRLDVECIDALLKDVTKPYGAPSKAAPKHALD